MADRFVFFAGVHMDPIEDGRRREARQDLLMLPYAALLLLLFAGIYVFLISDTVEFLGVAYYGFAKGIWFLNLAFIGGVALIFIVLSLSALIMFGLIARNLSIRMHPWKPMVVSTLLLILGFVFLLIALYVNNLLSLNVISINQWLDSFMLDGWVIGLLWLFVAPLLMMLTGFMFGLVSLAASLPFHAKELAKQLRDPSGLS